MQWPEFMELQRCLLAWHNMFRQYDADRSGFIEAQELGNVIRAFGKAFFSVRDYKIGSCTKMFEM